MNEILSNILGWLLIVFIWQIVVQRNEFFCFLVSEDMVQNVVDPVPFSSFSVLSAFSDLVVFRNRWYSPHFIPQTGLMSLCP